MLNDSISGITISVKNVNQIFNLDKQNEFFALSDINLEIKENEFVSLLGPSGCGKTTLLRLISGLNLPSGGEIVVNNKQVTGPIDNCSMMFQSATLLKWRTALDNVILPAEAKGLNVNKLRNDAKDLLNLVGLSGFEDHYPRELSGGMQQRVSLARALLLDPPIMLMDEPFGALDALTRDIMGNELLRIWKQNPKTVVFVTHSVREAISLSDRVCVMKTKPGRISKIFEIPYPRPRISRYMGESYNDLLDGIHNELGVSLENQSTICE